MSFGRLRPYISTPVHFSVQDCLSFIGTLDVSGGSGNDLITGGAAYAYIRGDGGNDTIFGGASGDLIVGGTGDDAVSSGGGLDVVLGSTST